MVDIDPYPIAELLNRYCISSRQTVADRLKHLGISPHKIQNRSYITLEELGKMDALNKFLEVPGRKMNEFSSPATHPEVATLGTVDTSGRQYETLTPYPDVEGLIALVRAIAEASAERSKPADPLQSFRDLQEVAENGWLLTSSQVQELTGVKPKGDRFIRGSFTFVRSGKIGAQSAWRVERLR